MTRLLAALSVFAGLVFGTALPVAAQQGDESAESVDARIVPPELLTAAEAPHPAEALDEDLEADVFIEMDVGIDGAVANPVPIGITYYWYDDAGDLQEEVGDVESDEWGFIESAMQAVVQYEFAPARQVTAMQPEGEIIAVRLTWRVGFVIDYEEITREAEASDFEGQGAASQPADSQPSSLPADSQPSSLPADSQAATSQPATVDGVDPTQAPEDVGALDGNAPVNFEGRVLERGRRDELASIRLQLWLEPHGPAFETYTDAEGAFEFRGLPAGEYAVLIDDIEFQPFEASEVIDRESVTVATYRIQRLYFDEFRSVTTAEAPPREVTRRTLEVTEIQRIAGNNNDAIKVVQSLPGVARASFAGGDIIVRGGEATDTLFFIDGMPIPNVYHFGGLRSVFPSEMLDSVDFYPGNFGARFGRATAGVVSLESTADIPDEFGGHIDVNVFDSGFFFEGPISDRLHFQVGARRSYIDVVLRAVQEVLPLNFTVAPRYYDYQLKLEWEAHRDHRLSLMLIGSDDLVDLVLADESELEADQRGGLRAQTSFHSALFRVDSRLSDTVTNRFRMIAGFQQFGFFFGDDIRFDLKLRNMSWRNEIEWTPSEVITARVGIDINYNPGTIDIRAPLPPLEGEAVERDFLSEEPIEAQNSFRFYQPAMYASFDIRPIPKLQILPGIRLDYFRPPERWSVDPRLSVRYTVSDLLTLKGAVGWFHRSPDPDQVSENFGNPNAQLEDAVHYALGAELQFNDYLSLDVEVFYKDLNNLITRSQTSTDESDSDQAIYNSEGTGRVYGAEIFLRHAMANNFFGWMSYTISRSERFDVQSGRYRLFDNDQTHILTLLGSYNLPKNWSIGAKFRLISNNPYTPYKSPSSFNANSGEYVLEASGDTNSRRLPAFHQLDIRVDKRWVFPLWTLNLYLDMQNVYNQQNVEGITQDYNNRETANFVGLPLIPSLGIRAEF